MRVLMLNYEFPPLGGGAANANEHLLEQMTDIEGLKIDLVTSSEESYTEQKFSEDITIHRLDVKKEEIHHWRQIEVLRYFLKGFFKSRKLVEKHDYELVHAWFGFPCGLMALMLGKPYIVSLRGSDVPGFNERFSLQYVFLKPVLRQIWKRAEKVISNSVHLKELAQRTLDISIEVIPNGVDTESFRPSKTSKIQSERLELICVARLTKRKRVDDILEAIKGLDVNLTLIGEGEEEQKLKQRAKDLEIEDRVYFEGYIPHHKIPRFYRNSDIFVLPSLNEGMSNTILEAMASGLPIITTRTGDAEKLVSDNGFIVPMKEPKAIRKTIISYRDDPEKIKSEGLKSRERAEAFSWSSVAEKYLEVFQDLSDKSTLLY